MWRTSLFAVVVATACATGSDGSAVPTTVDAVPTTVAPTTTEALVAGCPGEGEFEEGGPIVDLAQAGSDSDTIGFISWESTESCETFTVEFETSEGAPPTTPPSVLAEYLEPVPVIRIQLDVQSTVITDQFVETPMVERLFVVRDLDGRMFIDFHMAAPAQARITTQSSPARLVLELQPGIVDYAHRPAISEHVALLNPVDGIGLGGEVSFFGYSRTFESNVLVIGTSQGEVVFEEFTTAADSVDTWGEFQLDAELPPGQLSVFVGEESAVDGSLEGVTINLRVG